MPDREPEPGQAAATQAQVDFYLLQSSQDEARSRFAMRITEKACSQGHRVYLVAAGIEQERHLDDQMWTFRDYSFLPHAIAASVTGDSRRYPVLIGSAEPPLDMNDILINLQSQVPAFFSGFRRVIEIIDASDAGKADGRRRFRFYRGHGIEPRAHRIRS